MKIYRGLPECFINPSSYGKLLRRNPPIELPRKPRSAWQKLLFMALLVGIVLIGSCKLVMAENISDKDAVIAIIGEAENQGYQGMLAVAGAIRNRETLKGVYGLKSKRAKAVFESNGYIRRLAIRAWNESLFNDITHGATHWENIKAFGKPAWACEMVKTFEYKDHVFYREEI